MAKQFHNTNYSDPYQEIAFVTSLIYMPEMIGEILKVMPSAEAIQHETIRTIYESVCKLFSDGKEINQMSVRFEIMKAGKKADLDKSGMSLEFDSFTPADPEMIMAACEGLISLYRKQLAYNLNLKLNASLEGAMTDQELSDSVLRIYDALTIHGGGSFEKTSEQAARGALAKMDKARKLYQTKGMSGIPTGSNKLDRELGCWQNDEVIILAGRPAMGKTSCALDFMYSAAKRGHVVGFFSCEMDSEDLNYRLASIETGIPYTKMIKGWQTDEEWVQIETALEAIGKLPIYYYDDVSIQNVGKLSIIAKEWCRKRKVELIFIDYIQYLQANDKLGNSTEQISAVSKAIKSLQRSLKIPIIAMAQLGRQVDSRPDPRPRKEDLKESGQLEQDASTIIGLFYPDEYERIGRLQYDENKGKEERFDENAYCLYLLKRRSGSYARIDRYCDLATNRFSDTSSFNQSPQFPTNKSFDGFQHSF